MGHNFLIAAYCATWAIQLFYLGWTLTKAYGQRGKISRQK